MNIRMLVGLTFFAIAMTGIALGNFFWFRMISEVNRGRSHDGQFSHLGSNIIKNTDVLAAYRKAYPNGRTHIHAACSIGMAVAGFVALAIWVRMIG